jgi:hypothetical protein
MNWSKELGIRIHLREFLQVSKQHATMALLTVSRDGDGAGAAVLGM